MFSEHVIAIQETRHNAHPERSEAMHPIAFSLVNLKTPFTKRQLTTLPRSSPSPEPHQRKINDRGAAISSISNFMIWKKQKQWGLKELFPIRPRAITVCQLSLEALVVIRGIRGTSTRSLLVLRPFPPVETTRARVQRHRRVWRGHRKPVTGFHKLQRENNPLIFTEKLTEMKTG